MKQARPKSGLAPASGAVGAWLGSQDLARALRPHMAKAQWASVVGPQVAAVTQVEAVREGVLFVRVTNGVWANELTLLRDDMVRRLNRALGGAVITDIHFKASGLRRGKKGAKKAAVELPSDAELARVAVSPEARARAVAAIQGITDEKLRDLIFSSLLRAARREEWKRRAGWQPCAECGTLIAPAPDVGTYLCPLCVVGAGGPPRKPSHRSKQESP